MASLIVLAFVKKPRSKEWCFYVSYLWLVVLILTSSVILFIRAKTVPECHRLMKSHCVEFMVLEIFTMAMQMLSWHLVFVFYGFILNPLRAFLYSTTIIIVVACSIIVLALVLKAVFKYICMPRNTANAADTANVNGIILMWAVPIFLTFMCTYCLSILGISISSSNGKIDEITKSVIPKAILIVTAWFIYHMISNSDNRTKLWSLLKIIMDETKLKEYIQQVLQGNNNLNINSNGTS